MAPNTSRCPICHRKNCTTRHRDGTRDRRAVARAAYARRRAGRYVRGWWPAGSSASASPLPQAGGVGGGQIIATGTSAPATEDKPA